MRVIYSPEQNAVFDRQVGFSSPSASKPEKVIPDGLIYQLPEILLVGIKSQKMATSHLY